MKWPSGEKVWGGWTGAFREKRTQWSQIMKGEEKQGNILAILALSQSKTAAG